MEHFIGTWLYVSGVYIICISKRNDPIVNWNSYVYSFKPKCLFILLNHSLKMNLVTMTIKSISIKMLLLNTLRMLYPLFRNYDNTEILWTSIQFWNMFGKRLSEKAYKYIYQFISEMKWTKCVHTKFREKKKSERKKFNSSEMCLLVEMWKDEMWFVSYHTA